MRTLQKITPTPEQLPIISRTRPGLEIIRGAAGSGKTTTALLRLRSLVGFFSSRKRRAGDTSPLRALVLTYNRTLRGYISALVAEEAQHFEDVDLCVTTFGQWARNLLGRPEIIDAQQGQIVIRRLAQDQDLDPDFIADEVEYVLGRFPPTEIALYVATARVGRGRNPRMPRAAREQLISEVINPYTRWKAERGLVDWHDVAVEAMNGPVTDPIDIVVADETQDFSANQIRSVVHHLARRVSTTLRHSVR